MKVAHYIIIIMLCILLAALQALGHSKVNYAPAKEWKVTGDLKHKYAMGVDDKGGQKGQAAVTIKSNKYIMLWGDGVLKKTVNAYEYRGKRVELSGYLKAKDVKKWAGFWMRIDDSTSGQMLAFDNMRHRAVKGTRGWEKYVIVLDVPALATDIAYGVQLAGKGQIWCDDIKLEVVSKEIPLSVGK